MSGSLIDRTDYSKMPEHFRDATERYLRNGTPPGHFLEAVIKNDLLESFNRADKEAKAHLHEIVLWFYWEAPGGSWGDKRAYDAMIAGKGYVGMRDAHHQAKREK